MLCRWGWMAPPFPEVSLLQDVSAFDAMLDTEMRGAACPIPMTDYLKRL